MIALLATTFGVFLGLLYLVVVPRRSKSVRTVRDLRNLNREAIR